MNILVIDNDESMRIGAIEILKMKGFQANCVSDIDKAVDMLKNEVYDLIISSIDSNVFNTPFIYLKKPYTAEKLIDSISILNKGD